ncbi:putative zinc transporter msc2 [Tulasnella sp. 403]|nr:putative zinc transporter msc2 [Tulasnella sp. 403]
MYPATLREITIVNQVPPPDANVSILASTHIFSNISAYLLSRNSTVRRPAPSIQIFVTLLVVATFPLSWFCDTLLYSSSHQSLEVTYLAVGMYVLSSYFLQIELGRAIPSVGEFSAVAMAVFTGGVVSLPIELLSHLWDWQSQHPSLPWFSPLASLPLLAFCGTFFIPHVIRSVNTQVTRTTIPSTKYYWPTFLASVLPALVVGKLIFGVGITVWDATVAGLLAFATVKGIPSGGIDTPTHTSTARLLRTYLKVIMENPDSRKIFYFLMVNLAYMVIQMLWGFWTNSLGLVSDAIHMLFDCFSVAVGLMASIMATWPPNERFTYGYGRIETISGFANGIFLLLISIFIVFEAVQRIIEPPEMGNFKQLLVVSSLGLAVNLFGMFAIGGHHHHVRWRGSRFVFWTGNGIYRDIRTLIHTRTPIRTHQVLSSPCMVTHIQTTLLTTTVILLGGTDAHMTAMKLGMGMDTLIRIHTANTMMNMTANTIIMQTGTRILASLVQIITRTVMGTPMMNLTMITTIPTLIPIPIRRHHALPMTSPRPAIPTFPLTLDPPPLHPRISLIMTCTLKPTIQSKYTTTGMTTMDTATTCVAYSCTLWPYEIPSPLLATCVLIHAPQDTLGSVGVIVSTILIELYGWTGFDPIASLFIAILIAASVVPLVIDCGRVLCLDIGDKEDSVRQALQELSTIDGVSSYSEARFWPKDASTMIGSIHVRLAQSSSSIDSTGPHLIKKPAYANVERVVKRVETLLKNRIPGLDELSIQVEGS